jgi:hypothetical protein
LVVWELYVIYGLKNISILWDGGLCPFVGVYVEYSSQKIEVIKK